MATFLGTWELGQGYGHIAHLAPVAAALGDRGHRMPVASRNPATARAAPGSPFAEVIEPPLHAPAAAPAETLTYAQVVADGGFGDADAAVALVERWLRLFERVAPDAVVAEHAPMSLLAAHVAGLPAAMLGSGFLVPPARRPFPSLMPWLAHGEAARRAADAAADAVVRSVCAAFGAPRLEGLAALLGRAPAFLTTWPELDPYGPRRGATYYGVMSGFRAAATAAWPPGDGPRVYVYVPFAHPAATALAAALAGLGWPTVWHSVGREAPSLPATIRHSPVPLDMPHMLGEAALLVSRGGHATACEAILAGRPNLVLPDSLDTVLIGRKLTENRLGLATLQRDAAGLGAALERLAGDSATAAAARSAQARYRRYHPAAAAGQLADRLLAELGW